MRIKIILPVCVAICLMGFIKGSAQAAVSEKAYVSQDSIPPINTIVDENIDTVRDRIKTNTIDVKLKNGSTYSYDSDKTRKQWENKPGLAHKIEKIVNDWRKTFTKVEHPASFPGGDEAWNDYIKKYIAENKALLKHKGSGEVYVQFIVDKDGELSDVRLAESSDSKLVPFAIDAVKKSPFWLPAMQNGYKVVAYQKVIVSF